MYGSEQIEIRKGVKKGRTSTTAEAVSGSERVGAIATMMATGEPTVQNLRSAAEMLKGAQQ